MKEGNPIDAVLRAGIQMGIITTDANHSYDSLNSMIQEFVVIIKSLPEIFSSQPALAIAQN